MTKGTKAFLLLCTLVLFLTGAAAEEETITTAEALQAHFIQCRDAELADFTAPCTPALCDELIADNYSALYRICYLSGMKTFRFSINTNGEMKFTNVTYAGKHIAPCDTEEELRSALEAFLAEDAQQISLLCTDGLFRDMYVNGRMYRLMAEQGIDTFTMQGTNSNVIFLSEFKPYDVPCAPVSDINEAGEALSLWAETKETAFNLLFDEEAYTALTRDDYSLIAFLGGLDDYRLSYSGKTSMLFFSDVTYSDVPGIYCTSEEAVVAAIRSMGANGFTAFQLKLDEATFQSIYSDASFSRLYELEAQAGMSDSDMRYSTISHLLLFENAVINSDARILNTLEEVIAYVDACVANEEQSIYLLLAPAVYDELMDGVSILGGGEAKFYDLIANAGISHADDIRFNRKSGAINLEGIHYYSGLKIALAVEKGNTASLTSREMQVLDAARSMAQQCRRDTPAATALAIHNALCALITYTDDETTDDDDCCIGALLRGEANCDGYADAMLLVGRLAGLKVRYQHGDSLNKGLGNRFSTHMWNLIQLDGTWRMIDVTWDDNGDSAYTLWFNIGEDRASLSHIWSKDMTVPMLAKTDAASRPTPEYMAATAEEITAAAQTAGANGDSVFDIYVTDPEFNRFTAGDVIGKGLDSAFYYTWVDSLHCLHVEITP